MSFKNVYFDRRSKKIHLWENENGKTKKKIFNFVYDYYVPDTTGSSQIKDIYGNLVEKRVTNNKKEIESLKDFGKPICESDISEEIKFLQERYKGEELTPDMDQVNICYIDIEIAVGFVGFKQDHKIKIRKKSDT